MEKAKSNHGVRNVEVAKKLKQRKILKYLEKFRQKSKNLQNHLATKNQLLIYL